MGQPNKNSQNNLQEQACSEYWWANEWEDQNYKVISVSPRTKSIPALEEKKTYDPRSDDPHAPWILGQQHLSAKEQ